MTDGKITVEEFRELMRKGTAIEMGSDLLEALDRFSQEAIKITMEINTKYNTPERIRELFSQLTASKIGENFRMFPPFYTECGKNLKIGNNVFINANCRFQDNGGIDIGEDTMIGQNVTIVTLNHDINPKTRKNTTPQPVKIGKNGGIVKCCVSYLITS